MILQVTQMYNRTKMIGELNECLFRLRKPLADFLCKILPPLFNDDPWEEQVFEELEQSVFFSRVIKQGNIETIHDFDVSMLLNVLLNYFNRLRDYYNTMPNKEYLQYFGKFNERYLTQIILEHRRLIAHPNDKTANIETMRNMTNDFIEFGKYIGIDKTTIRSIEMIQSKYSKYQIDKKEEKEKNERIKFIEDRALRDALNNEELDDDIKDSILTTLFRFKIKKTSKEIDDFFIGAQETSSRGQVVRDALREKNLLAFEDIREEYEKLFIKKDI